MEIPHARGLITGRILSLAPLSTYDHSENGAVAAAWHESSAPLVPEREPVGAAHLAFFVDDRQTDDSGQIGDEELYLVSRVVVRFLFELRPSAPKTDWDGAGYAAAHLLRHLLHSGTWASPADELEIDTRPGGVITRRPMAEPYSGFLAVEVLLDARFPFDTTPRS